MRTLIKRKPEALDSLSSTKCTLMVDYGWAALPTCVIRFLVARLVLIESQLVVCAVDATLCLLPEGVEQVHEAVVDHERDGNIQTDARQARNRSLVEGHRTLVLQDLSCAMQGVLVLRRFESLHSGLDDVKWGVAEHTR